MRDWYDERLGKQLFRELISEETRHKVGLLGLTGRKNFFELNIDANAEMGRPCIYCSGIKQEICW